MTAQAQPLRGKYLIFVVGQESFGVPVLQVREIIRLAEITPVPQMPPFVKGVINLRGKIIPVADLRVKFGLPALQPTERSCIIVVQTDLPSGSSAPIGLMVDAVEEVAAINSEQLEPPPDFGGGLSADHILAMAKLRSAVVTLLDLKRVVAAEFSAPPAPKPAPANAAFAPCRA